jgi:hypothetical protein
MHRRSDRHPAGSAPAHADSKLRRLRRADCRPRQEPSRRLATSASAAAASRPSVATTASWPRGAPISLTGRGRAGYYVFITPRRPPGLAGLFYALPHGGA